MKYLFVHQNFPGQFLHLVRHLNATGTHEVVFITEPNANVISGVRKVVYQLPHPPSAETHPDAREFDIAALRGETVARTARNLKTLGFAPDIVIGHHGWGELLNIQDVFPDAPLLGYYEFYYHANGTDVDFDPEFPFDPAGYPRLRARNIVNLLGLTNGGHGQTPTEWQRSTYPGWARRKLTLLREGVALETCRPDPAIRAAPLAIGDIAVGPDEKLVTYVARDLEPYRGFHILMRAIPRLLRERPDVRVIVVGGDGVSYGAKPARGSWREMMLAEQGEAIDPARVHFPGKIDYQSYLRMLQRSDAHVYLTYPFVASWSLREALACGCAVVASDTQPVREFVTDGANGLLVPFHDPERVAAGVLDVLENRDLSGRLRDGAREFAETHLALGDHIAAYEALIGRLTGLG